MGYFPLPELKGKPNRIFVEGKTLNQIAKESGIRLDTVQHRYSRGIRDYEGLTKPSHIRVAHEKAQRKTYSIMSAGERVMERIWELDIPLQTISDKTGISRSTIYAFLYNGTDLSSMRLLLGFPLTPNKHNSALALVQLPIPQKRVSAFLFCFIHVKAQVLYSNPHDLITSKASSKNGIVTHIKSTLSSSANFSTGRAFISSNLVTV